MNKSLAHRGPDGQGVWTSGNIGIGHTRLAIIDISERGSQPMTSQDGESVLSYNGEIYNLGELRSELTNLGYTFRTFTDTEVLLFAMKEWGIGAVSKLNGMFAFAFFNRRSGELILARDRYGIKPLYIATQGKSFFFGSEQKAFLHHPDFRKTINIYGLAEYLTYQNFLSNQTMTSGVSMLAAGHFMTLNIFSGETKTVSYWDFNFSSEISNGDPREYAEELVRLLDQAVTRQLKADVDVGAYLSGGIDSGMISALGQRVSGNLPTFSLGFSKEGLPSRLADMEETGLAERVALHLGTMHTSARLDPSDVSDAIPLMVKHAEEPRVGQTYPNYRIAAIARGQVKVVLSGIGGDELFAGYPWRYAGGHSPDSREAFVNWYFASWQRLGSQQEISELMSPLREALNDFHPKKYFDHVIEGANLNPDSEAEKTSTSLYFESKTFLHGLLVMEDKLSMAHGLETRVPFLDNDLVDFAMSCPLDMKINGLQQSGREFAGEINHRTSGKRILRLAAEGFLPNESARAPKRGFSFPDESWFRKELRPVLLSSAEQIRQLHSGVLDWQVANRLIYNHVNGTSNNRLLMWSLLYLAEYLKDFE